MQALSLPPPSTPVPTIARRCAPCCGVCGCAELRTDEVADRVLVRLAHCTRCDHRWTEPLTPAPAPAVVVRRVGRTEVRPAA